VLRPDELRLLGDLLAARTGLHLGPESRVTVERRLRERLRVLGLGSFTEYHQYLRFGAGADAEWDTLVDLLATHETYFFREERQLRALKEEVLPMLRRLTEPRRRLVVWSVGCSTGEEAYTLAIVIQRSGLFPRHAAEPEPEPWEVRVHGIDLSSRCVEAARRAWYGEHSLRVTPPEVKAEFFESRGKAWRVKEAVRQVCTFSQMNVLDAARSRVLRSPDAIVCRNVLLYLDAHARKSAIDLLYRHLSPGGFLLLGHSESLLNVSTAFELVHLRDDLVYRKPAWAAPPPAVPPTDADEPR
jgi:chemotaxis protein methyltransferase CheR